MRPSPARVRGPLPSALTTALSALVTAALLSSGVGAAAHAAPTSPDTSGSQPSCDGSAMAAVFDPEPVGEAVTSRTDRATVRAVNDLTFAQVRDIEADPAAWVDECGAVFYVEAPTPSPTTPTPTAPSARALSTAAQTPPDVLNLSSRPGSNRTIYLDFTGEVTTGTAWNTTAYGDPILSGPYSLNAPADTNFDAEERAEIYTAWRSVSEDFAPFDVNVTTAEPPTDALTRTSSSDPTYGTRAVITPTNVIGDGCGCGGVAYLDTFDLTGSQRYQPAWVFSNAAGRTGANIAQAISHEVGHNFGLSHDGNTTQSYDSGYDGWAPIMGASYSRRVSHWSAGEYPGANNTEDDVAIIAAMAPVVADDHANGPSGATILTDHNPLTGVLGTRTDIDAFTFTAAGKTVVSVSGPDGISNADLSLRILNSAGQQIGDANPTRPDATPEAAMHATWSATLPPTASTYTVIVDGVGFGAPTTLGRYSDYGSLGAYVISLSANDPTPALTVTATTPTLTARVGQPLAPTRLVEPQGGHPPYAYTAAVIPSGMSFDTGGNLFGTPEFPGSQWLSITVIDSHGATVSADIALTIDPAAPVNPTDPTGDGTGDDTTGTDTGTGDGTTLAPKFRSGHLPTARHGNTYKAKIRYTGPDGTKARVRGLPAGLRVTSNRSGLVLRGTPKAPGRYRVKVTLVAKDATIRRAFTLRVR